METCTLPDSFTADLLNVFDAIILASVSYGTALALLLTILAYTAYQLLSLHITPRLILARRRARRRRALSHAKTAKQGTPV